MPYSAPPDLARCALVYEGVPYRHQGRQACGPRAGIDCLGLLVLAARDHGRPLEDFSGYDATPDGVLLQRECDRQLLPCDKTDIQPNRILLMKFLHRPQHLAIVTASGMVHSYRDAGKVVRHALDDKWRRRIVGVYALG